MKLNLSTLEGDSGYCKIAKLSTKTGDFSIYFEFPSALKDDLTDKADPLVISLIFVLMQAGGAVLKYQVRPFLLPSQPTWNIFQEYGIAGTLKCINQ